MVLSEEIKKRFTLHSLKYASNSLILLMEFQIIIASAMHGVLLKNILACYNIKTSLTQHSLLSLLHGSSLKATAPFCWIVESALHPCSPSMSCWWCNKLQQAGQVHPPHLSTPYIMLPEKYSGDPASCFNFLLVLECYLAGFLELTEGQKTALLLLWFTGSALEWAPEMWQSGGTLTVLCL